jgi:hypothetical protein
MPCGHGDSDLQHPTVMIALQGLVPHWFHTDHHYPPLAVGHERHVRLAGGGSFATLYRYTRRGRDVRDTQTMACTTQGRKESLWMSKTLCTPR